jgi:hypothetical protein
VLGGAGWCSRDCGERKSSLGYTPLAVRQVVSTATVSPKVQDHEFFWKVEDGLDDFLIQILHFAYEEAEVQSRSKAVQETSEWPSKGGGCRNHDKHL